MYISFYYFGSGKGLKHKTLSGVIIIHSEIQSSAVTFNILIFFDNMTI
jgi:hypothetical protein